jgi:hypothetical protein
MPFYERKVRLAESQGLDRDWTEKKQKNGFRIGMTWVQVDLSRNGSESYWIFYSRKQRRTSRTDHLDLFFDA